MFGLERTLGTRLVTYADDLVILCRRGKAEAALQRLREIMGKLKLTVSEEKTRVCKVPEGEFDFLGYTFGRMFSARTGEARIGYRPSRKSIQRVVEKVHAGEQSEPHAARVGELLPSRDRQQGVSGARRLHSGAVAPVVTPQAQSQAGRELSTLAPLRALRARAPDPAWARRAVDEGVRSVREPDAGNLYVRLCVQRRLACSAGERPAGARVRGPVVWIAGWRETKTLKPIDNVSLGKTTSHRAVTTVNAKVASKMRSPEGRAPNRRAKAAWGAEI